MTNKNTDRSEIGKLLKKGELDNVDKEIFPLADHFIAKEKTQESEIGCETLLETILDIESDNKLSEYLKNSRVFNMKLKKSKRKLQKFSEYHPELSVPIDIRRDARRNDGVKCTPMQI